MKKVYLLILVMVLGTGAVFFIKSAKKTKNTSKLTEISSDKEERNEIIPGKKIKDGNFTVYKPDLDKETIKMYWKDKDNKAYSEVSKINLADGDGNFYMQPNGVFYIQDNQPKITESKSFEYAKNISYATQSGPLLIENGVINKKIGKDSKSLKIRSAVGIDKANKVFFLMSSEMINFYDFSKYALDKLNCKELLFLDGTISKMYFAEENKIPEQDYPFVVIITAEKK